MNFFSSLRTSSSTGNRYSQNNGPQPNYLQSHQPQTRFAVQVFHGKPGYGIQPGYAHPGGMNVASMPNIEASAYRSMPMHHPSAQPYSQPRYDERYAAPLPAPASHSYLHGHGHASQLPIPGSVGGRQPSPPQLNVNTALSRSYEIPGPQQHPSTVPRGTPLPHQRQPHPQNAPQPPQYSIYPSVNAQNTFVYEQSHTSKSDLFSISDIDTEPSPTTTYSPTDSTITTRGDTPLVSPIDSEPIHRQSSLQMGRSGTPLERPPSRTGPAHHQHQAYGGGGYSPWLPAPPPSAVPPQASAPTMGRTPSESDIIQRERLAVLNAQHNSVATGAYYSPPSAVDKALQQEKRQQQALEQQYNAIPHHTAPTSLHQQQQSAQSLVYQRTSPPLPTANIDPAFAPPPVRERKTSTMYGPPSHPVTGSRRYITTTSTPEPRRVSARDPSPPADFPVSTYSTSSSPPRSGRYELSDSARLEERGGRDRYSPPATKIRSRTPSILHTTHPSMDISPAEALPIASMTMQDIDAHRPRHPALAFSTTTTPQPTHHSTSGTKTPPPPIAADEGVSSGRRRRISFSNVSHISELHSTSNTPAPPAPAGTTSDSVGSRYRETFSPDSSIASNSTHAIPSSLHAALLLPPPLISAPPRSHTPSCHSYSKTPSSLAPGGAPPDVVARTDATPPPPTTLRYPEAKRRHSDADAAHQRDIRERAHTQSADAAHPRDVRATTPTSASESLASQKPRSDAQRRYSDGDQNKPLRITTSFSRDNKGLSPDNGCAGGPRSVRWGDNLICASPVVKVQKRVGWFNRRGDQLWTNDGVFKAAPPGQQYPPDLEDYPEAGEGWMNEEGVQIDIDHRRVQKFPRRSALKHGGGASNHSF